MGITPYLLTIFISGYDDEIDIDCCAVSPVVLIVLEPPLLRSRVLVTVLGTNCLPARRRAWHKPWACK